MGSSTFSRSLLTEAECRLRSFSFERLRVANDFLAYLQEREENEATAELLSIPGFEAAFQRAVEQVERGEVVRLMIVGDKWWGTWLPRGQREILDAEQKSGHRGDLGYSTSAIRRYYNRHIW